MKRVIAQLLPESFLKQHRLNNERKRYNRYRSMEPEEYRSGLSEWYELMTGEVLNLEDPRSLNEKIQWLKLFDCTELKGILSDKYAMRGVIEKEFGPDHLVPLLGVWDGPEDIDFDILPEQFVLKTTQGSGSNIFVRGRNSIDIAWVRATMRDWLDTDYSFVNGFELHYGFTKNRVIAEDYMDYGSEGLTDYRFFCSFGKVFSIWVDTGSATHQYRRTIFTSSWEPLGVRATHQRHETPPTKPSQFDFMIKAARRLSEKFSLVRVDFYEYDQRAIIGELTFTPQSGLIDFDPESFNLTLGECVTMPSSKKPYKGQVL